MTKPTYLTNINNFNISHLRIILIAVVVVWLQGCTVMKMLEHGTMPEPELSYKDYRITNLDLEGVSIDLLFDAYNPGYEQMDTFFASYEFFLREHSVAAGTDIPITLIPEGTTELTVPVQVTYANLLPAVTTLGTLISEKQKTVDGKVNLDVHGEYFTFEFFGKRFTKPYHYNIDIDLEIPLPEITVETVGDKITESIKNFFGGGLFGSDKSEPPVGQPQTGTIEATEQQLTSPKRAGETSPQPSLNFDDGL